VTPDLKSVAAANTDWLQVKKGRGWGRIWGVVGKIKNMIGIRLRWGGEELQVVKERVVMRSKRI
jgi:hypothetical protein